MPITTPYKRTPKENYKLLSLCNFDANILNITLANRIRQLIKHMLNHEQVEHLFKNVRVVLY